MAAKKRVVIIGAGFGGLYAAQKLSRAKNVEVVLIDRNNFHTFTPLLYQVATCGLDPSAIAYPIRSLIRRSPNVNFLMGEVTAIDSQQQTVSVWLNGETRLERYDELILAAGSVTNHFGQQSIAENSYGLKSVDDAVKLRHHILKLFERAAWARNPSEKDAMTTFVVVGGGPTGIETAGALFELYNYVLKREYAKLTPKMRARVILLEAQDHLLGPYPEELREAAEKQLGDIGVEVLLNAMVSEVAPDHVMLRDGRRIDTHTLVWAAGVKAHPLAQMLGAAQHRGGGVEVERNMRVKDFENVYAIGDIAYLEDPETNKPYPMLIPVAKQQGILAAKNIRRAMKGKKLQEFSYSDRGIMATIGRSRAVAWIFYRWKVTGFVAWLSWLFLHLIVLLGFRNRLSVFINWVWNYITYDRSVRLILNDVNPESDIPQRQGTPDASAATAEEADNKDEDKDKEEVAA